MKKLKCTHMKTLKCTHMKTLKCTRPVPYLFVVLEIHSRNPISMDNISRTECKRSLSVLCVIYSYVLGSRQHSFFLYVPMNKRINMEI